MFWKKKTIKDLLPPPVKAAHGEYSMILSAHDDVPPTPSMIELSLKAIDKASEIDLSQIGLRLKNPPFYPNIWPGEHYRLLAGFIKALKPLNVIEIGTSTGLSALAMKEFLPRKGKITTFDIKNWQSYPDTVLKDEDFADGKLIQHIGDLSNPEILAQHRALLESANLIFIDATHDGKLEAQLMEQFQKLQFTTPPYLIFDDIRVWTMLKAWREISLPKMDLTSFGHWSGTGLVEWPRTSDGK